MPSTSSSVVSVVLPSSTVITPSLPTFSIASASRSPISGSLLALIAPTWAISSLLETGLAMRVQVLDRRVHGLFDAAAHGHRIAAGGDVAGAFLEDRAGQHRGRRRAVAGDVRGLRGDFVDQLGAHVLEAVFQLDFLADGHAVLGDGRAAERLVDDHVAAGRAHRDGDRVGQFLNALEHSCAGGIFEEQLFSHGGGSSYVIV